MSKDIQKLGLDEDSLEFLLNFILNNVKEDREIALQHHDTLAGLLQGVSGDGMNAMEIQMMAKELSEALKAFMSSAAVTTDQAIKIAKILSDLLVKADPAETLTDKERGDLEELIGGLKEEKDEQKNIINLGVASDQSR